MAKTEPLDPRVPQVHKEFKVPTACKEIQEFKVPTACKEIQEFKAPKVPKVPKARKALPESTDKRAGISMEMA
jgi:hypothetical protein